MKNLRHLLILFLIFNWLFSGFLLAQQEKTVDKTYENIKSIKLKLVLSQCEIKKSPDSRVHVHVVYSRGKDYEPRFSEHSGRLTLEEKFRDHDEGEGSSGWTVEVPAGLEIDLKTATGNISVSGVTLDIEVKSGTGNIEVTDAGGEYELSSGTGNIRVENSRGTFDLSSGTGDVVAEDCAGDFEVSSGTGKVEGRKITIDSDADFSSGTGDAKVTQPAGKDFKLEINSGTSDAVLDLQGKKVEGYFEFRAHARKGRIISPEKFDDEKEYQENGNSYVRKSFTRGGDKPQYFISTGTGEAELKK